MIISNEDLKKKLIITRIIWVAMILSVIIYAALCHLIVEKELTEYIIPLDSTDQFGLLKNILLAVSAVELAGGYFLRRFMVRLGSKATDQEKNAGGKYNLAVLISLSICESVAMFGLVLFLLSTDFETLYIFIAMSLAGMWFYRPKLEELEQLAAGMRNDRF